MKARLSSDIVALTALSGSAVFDPHVTLFGDLSASADKIRALCNTYLQGLGAIRTTVSDVAQTDTFFMSLFLDLDIPSSLVAARDIVGAALNVPPSRFRAHISLAYGVDKSALDKALMDRLRHTYIGQQIAFSYVDVVASARNIPIEDWHVVSRLPLSETNQSDGSEGRSPR